MIEVASYGLKHGDWGRPGWVSIDCRQLDNPHNDRRLKHLDGTNPEVKTYVRKSATFTNILTAAVEDVCDGAKRAFFCVGGRHRSVVCAIEFAEMMRIAGYEVSVFHRELDRS